MNIKQIAEKHSGYRQGFTISAFWSKSSDSICLNIKTEEKYFPDTICVYPIERGTPDQGGYWADNGKWPKDLVQAKKEINKFLDRLIKETK